MCTVIPGEHSHSTPSGVTAEGFLATFVILAAVALGGVIFQAAWVLIGVALVVAWICVFRPSRLLMFVACALLAAGVLSAARWAFTRRAKPVKAVALPREYTATVYVTAPDGRRAVLGTAPVPGAWTSRSDVEREVVRRWLAVRGRPAAGELGCHAQPVGGDR
jgi:hypothetical protein